ncbi:putative regulatory protein [Plesiocystis pacifica SIR-1]|uniref:Putative regulatory protein n=1 Tax=Plesiocystis pacifica SIR-1 TaxID=391625 RepID=A6GKA1_9BACT|nr:AAA family ATPase [Plesiocystis pacifica]EDM73707.1 putative regulatory protein [Plesiocystis pacifica SIR-1]
MVETNPGERARETWLGYGDNRAEAERLLTALELGEGFQLFVVQIGDALAGTHLRALIEAAAAESCDDAGAEAPHTVGSLELRRDTELSALSELFRETPHPRWFWLPTADTGEALENLFFLLNQKRDVLTRLADAPVAVAMHRLDWARFRRHAPDFWSIHQAVFRFSAARRDLDTDPGLLSMDDAAVSHADGAVGSIIGPTHGLHMGPGSTHFLRGRASGWRVQEPRVATKRLALYGRDAELRSLTAALESPGARVLVRGARGAGKTSLIRRVLPQVAGRYEGVWWIPVDELPHPDAPIDRAEHILRTLWAELAAGDTEGLELLDVYPRWFAATSRRRLLFVFDDVESQELVQWLMPGGKSSVVVATRSLRPHGDFDQTLNLAGLGNQAGVELLRSRGVEDEAQARRLVQRFAGRPRSLSQAGRLVALGRAPSPSPGETISGLITDVVAAGSPKARTLWECLSLFTATFTTEAAAAVGRLELEAADGYLDELLRGGLVDLIEDKPVRWHLPRRSRRLASEGFDEQPFEAQDGHRLDFCRWVLVTQAQLDGRGWTGSPDEIAAVDWLRSILEVTNESQTRAQTPDLLERAQAVLRDALGAWKRGEGSLIPLEVALFAAQAAGVSEGRADLSWSIGLRALMRLKEERRFDEALEWVEGLLAAGPTGEALGGALLLRAQLHRELGAPVEELVRELERARDLLGAQVQPVVQHELGRARLQAEDFDGAAAVFETLLAQARAQDLLEVERNALSELAEVRRHQGRLDEAEALLRQAIERSAVTTSILELTALREALAVVQAERGELDLGIATLDATLAELFSTYLMSEDPAMLAAMLEPTQRRAQLIEAGGDRAGAIQAHDQVLSLQDQVYGTLEHVAVAETEVRKARLLLAARPAGQRSRDSARKLLEHALPILERERPNSDTIRLAAKLLKNC